MSGCVAQIDVTVEQRLQPQVLYECCGLDQSGISDEMLVIEHHPDRIKAVRRSHLKGALQLCKNVAVTNIILPGQRALFADSQPTIPTQKRWIEAKTVAAVAGVVVATMVLPPAPAFAGAPAFECRIGSVRVGLDTHRLVALVRKPSGEVTRLALESEQAAGADQRYRLTGRSIIGRVDVGGIGSRAASGGSVGQGRGACAFMPGDFAIGTVKARRLALRVEATPAAEIAVVLRRGSLLWLDPTATAGERADALMVRVRVVLGVRGGRRGGGDQRFGMGPEAGLDGRSTVIDGWVRAVDVEWVGPPGP